MRDRLLTIAADCTALANDWPRFVALDDAQADGYPATTPGNGTAGVSTNSVSDPTPRAALTRAPHDDHRSAATREATTVTELCIALHVGLEGWDDIEWRPEQAHPAAALPIAARAALSAHGVWPRRAGKSVQFADGSELITVSPEEAVGLVWAHLAALSAHMRLPAPEIRHELANARCRPPSGRGHESWVDATCEALAVSGSGQCARCDRRRRRWEHHEDINQGDAA